MKPFRPVYFLQGRAFRKGRSRLRDRPSGCRHQSGRRWFGSRRRLICRSVCYFHWSQPSRSFPRRPSVPLSDYGSQYRSRAVCRTLQRRIVPTIVSVVSLVLGAIQAIWGDTTKSATLISDTPSCPCDSFLCDAGGRNLCGG